MAESDTRICNQALTGIGATEIVNLADTTDETPQAKSCRIHYEPTRDALLRSHKWRFASARATLSQDDTDPDFEWDNQFILPTDFMAMKSIYEGRFSDENIRSYALEGRRLLTNESSMEIRYIKKVTDASLFDSLFIEIFVLKLKKKLIGPLAGANPALLKEIESDIKETMHAVRAMDRQETNTIGTGELETWNDARYG